MEKKPEIIHVGTIGYITPHLIEEIGNREIPSVIIVNQEPKPKEVVMPIIPVDLYVNPLTIKSGREKRREKRKKERKNK